MKKLCSLTRSFALVACAAFASSFSSCSHTPALSSNANVAETLIGRPAGEAFDALGPPIRTVGTVNSGAAIWAHHKEFEVSHYVPGRSYTSTSYNPISDVYTERTVITRGYTYYTTDSITYLIQVRFFNRKISEIYYSNHNHTMAGMSNWKDANKTEMNWNSYLANDELKELNPLAELI